MSGSTGITYSLVNGPPPMTSDAYQSLLDQQWQSLLNSNPSESIVQRFFEKHPVLVPGAFGMIGLKSGHKPFPGGLISQPTLYGYQYRVPDFLWISKNSTTLSPVFIEIERPGKKVFKAGDNLHADFTQARHQITQWRQWIRVPNNQDTFIQSYGLNGFRNLTFEPQFLLIYGRSAEYVNDPNRVSIMKGLLAAPDEHRMSFDSVMYDVDAEQLLSLRHNRFGYYVKHIPPTYWMGPRMFQHGARLRNLSTAAANSPDIGAARSHFLQQRIPYWEQWLASRPSGFHGGHRE